MCNYKLLYNIQFCFQTHLQNYLENNTLKVNDYYFNFNLFHTTQIIPSHG